MARDRATVSEQIIHASQQGPIADQSNKGIPLGFEEPAKIVMTLDHDYDVVCKQGKNRYTQQLQVDLAAALRVPQGRIEVLELARGSVKATIALYDSGSGPAPLALVLELQRQLADPGSALKQGKVSCKALAIQSLALPGSAVGSSRVSEIGEDFVEELDGILSAHEFTKEDVAPSHKEVNILLWAACPCSADKEMCGLVQVPEGLSPAGTHRYFIDCTFPSSTHRDQHPPIPYLFPRDFSLRSLLPEIHLQSAMG